MGQGSSPSSSFLVQLGCEWAANQDGIGISPHTHPKGPRERAGPKLGPSVGSGPEVLQLVSVPRDHRTLALLRHRSAGARAGPSSHLERRGACRRTLGRPGDGLSIRGNLWFLALTGQRRDEVGRMRWDHLDPTGCLWVVPGEHAKNGKPHTVHLSPQSLELLNTISRTGDLVFSVDGRTVFQGYSKAKARLDELSEVSDWTLHDLRRTVVSGMARLGVAPHVADKILNHQTGTISGVAAVYQRHEFMRERKEALEVWGKHVQGPGSRSSNRPSGT
jgi:hypothetical protein